MQFFKNRLTQKHGLLATVLVVAAVLSVGTVSAARYVGPNPAKAAAKQAAPKQITLVENNQKNTLTPAQLGWSGSRIDQAVLTKKVTAIADATQQAPTDAKIITQNSEYVMSPSSPGKRVDVAKAVKMIKAALFTGRTAVELPSVLVAPSVTEASLQPQLQQLKAQQSAQLAAAKAAAASKIPASGPCGGNPAGRQLILVSLSQQHLWACAGTSQAYDTPITSGAYLAGMATPTGTWRIYSKSTNIHLTGPGYDDFVNYWMPFYTDYGFHDSSWQTFPYGSPQYASDGSHGCVHLPAAAMAWLYGWAPVGTTVTITG